MMPGRNDTASAFEPTFRTPMSRDEHPGGLSAL